MDESLDNSRTGKRRKDMATTAAVNRPRDAGLPKLNFPTVLVTLQARIHPINSRPKEMSTW